MDEREWNDEDRVVAHPKDADKARPVASDLGLDLQVHRLCPPGTIYVLTPSKLFDPDDDEWPRYFGRIDGLQS